MKSEQDKQKSPRSLESVEINSSAEANRQPSDAELESELQHLTERLEELPEYLDARIRRIEILTALGRDPEVLEDVALWLTQQPECAEAHFVRAQTLGLLGDSVRALEAYQRAVTLDPNNSDYHSGLGLAFVENEEFVEARQAFDRALEIDPGCLSALVRRSRLLANELRDFNASLEDLDRALAIDAANAELHFYRADTLFMASKPAEALLAYDQALAIEPEIVPILNNKALCLAHLKDYGGAYQCLSHALELAPESDALRRFRGELLWKLGRVEEGLVDLHFAAESKDDEIATLALFQRAEILDANDEPEAALRELERARIRRPDEPEILAFRGMLLHKIDPADPEAIELLDRAAHSDTNHPERWLTLARVLREKGHFKAARTALRRASTIDLGHLVEFELGYLLKAQGKLRKSEQAFRRAYDLDPGLVDALVEAVQIQRILAETPEQLAELANRIGEYLERHPNQAKLHIEFAGLANQRKRESEAREHLTRALELEGDNVAALVLLGKLSADDPKRAKQLYSRAIAEQPKHIQAHLALAAIAHSESDLPTTLIHVETVLDLERDNVQALLQKAECLLDGGEEELGFDILAHALTVDPRNPLAYLSRGEAHYDRGRLDAALSDFNQALKLDPQLTDALYGRGWVSIDIQDNDQAVDDFLLARELNKTNHHILVGLGWAFHLVGDSESGHQTLTQAIDMNPFDAEAYVFRGRVFQELGDRESLDKALRDFEAAISLDPDDAAAHTGRGFVYLELGETVRALADFARGIALDPDDTDALVGRGEAYLLLKDLDRAADDFNLAISVDANNMDAFLGRAQVRLDNEEYERALEDCDRAIKLDAENPLAFRRRAKILRALERVPEAEAADEQANKLDSEFDDFEDSEFENGFETGDYDSSDFESGEFGS